VEASGSNDYIRKLQTTKLVAFRMMLIFCISDVKSSRMLSRSGAIQAAINLELSDEDINYMEILVESLNGQLPNLDLVNMVIRLCRSQGIPVALKRLVSNLYVKRFVVYDL
jgi:methylglyoxal synthase